MTYLRQKLQDSKITGLPEVISEEDAMKVLKELWNDPDKLLDKGEWLGVVYWKEE